MSILLRAWPRVEEFWFDEPLPRGVDVAYRYQSATAPDAHATRKSTLIIDLARPTEQLLAAMNEATRYDIRRAQSKDGFVFASPAHPDEPMLADFHAHYSEFAREKKLPPVTRGYLDAAVRSKTVRLSSMSKDGQVLVWHSYLVVGSRARLWHSASVFRGLESAQRSMVARANRLLHWLDMQHFKNAGAALYDFGGWYAGQTDTALLGINKFKEGFGGEVREEFNGVSTPTLLGRLYMLARRLRNGA